MDNMGVLFLTSTGLSADEVYEKFKSITDQNKLKNVVIITTASLGKEKNQYSQLAFEQLETMGFDSIDFYDFESDSPKSLSSYDVIYVCGGNTFKLMKFARTFKFDEEIKSLLKRGGAYIGVSAGSLIVGPSIQIANEVHPDRNEVGLTDFTGFNITELIIFPHYSSELEDDIKLFEEKNGVDVTRLTNTQAILIENGKKNLIG